jgi:hypothetical protein
VVPSLPFCLCDILTVSILVPDHFEYFAYARGHQYLNIQIFVLLSYLRVVVRKLVQEYQFGLVPWRDILRCNNNNKRYYSVIEVPTAALHWRNGGEYRAPFYFSSMTWGTTPKLILLLNERSRKNSKNSHKSKLSSRFVHLSIENCHHNGQEETKTNEFGMVTWNAWMSTAGCQK